MNLNRTHTRAGLWNEYKRLTNPATRDLVFRRPGTTKRVILNEIKRIKKQERLDSEERRKIQKKFREILSEIKKPPLYQIMPQITIYQQRYGADTIETIETIVNPIIENTSFVGITV